MKNQMELSRKLTNTISSFDINIKDRSAVLCVGVAVQIAYSLELPSSEVEDIYSHYALVHGSCVSTKVSEVNEAYVLDTDNVMVLVKAIYKMRYNAVYNPMYLDVGKLLSCSRMTNIPPAQVDILTRSSGVDNGAVQRVVSCVKGYFN